MILIENAQLYGLILEVEEDAEGIYGGKKKSKDQDEDDDGFGGGDEEEEK